jgi:hypothetical protein
LTGSYQTNTVNKALIHCNAAPPDHLPHLKAVKLSTFGILFFGTPHRGANDIPLSKLLLGITFIFMHTNTNIFRQLDRDSEALSQLVDEFLPQGDIKRYLSYHLCEISRERNLGDCPSHKHIDQLVTMSADLFIFAATLIKFLKDKYHSNARHQLQILFRVRSSSGPSPFKDLDALYLHVLNQALPEEPDEDLTRRLQINLGAIVLL